MILVIGGGKMGMSHLALLTKYLGKKNVGLCDNSLKTRLLFEFLGYQTFASPDTALRKVGKFDGVLIATPTSSHYALAKWAIEKQLPFFVEKPFTLDFEKSSALVEFAQKANVYGQLGFVLRYLTTVQRLKTISADGQLGVLNGYRATMNGNVVAKPHKNDSWQGDFARGGGCLNEYGPHILDLCHYLFGPVTGVVESSIGQTYSTRADDRFSTQLIHSSGIKGTVSGDWSDPTKRKSVFEITAKFEHAIVRADNSALEIQWRDTSPVPQSEREQLAATVRPSNVAFYLRGEEFSLEIEDFLSVCLAKDHHADPLYPRDVTPLLSDGREVDLLISKIARDAGL